MSDYIFVRPAEDSAGVQVAAWGQALLQKIVGCTPIDLAGTQATRANIEGQLAGAPHHLFWFGHGRADALISEEEPLVDLANVGLLAGAVIVAIACDTAISLGPESVDGAGIAAFLGFDDRFGFPALAPLPMAQAIIEGLACMLTMGHEIGCAHRQVHERLNHALTTYRTEGAAWGLAESDAETAWLWAKSNRDSLRLYGDPTATL